MTDMDEAIHDACWLLALAREQDYDNHSCAWCPWCRGSNSENQAHYLDMDAPITHEPDCLALSAVRRLTSNALSVDVNR